MRFSQDLHLAAQQLQQRISDLPPEKTILAGFSQGAITVMDLMLNQPNYAGMMFWSGQVYNRSEWLERLSTCAHQLPEIMMSHGEFDPVLPIFASKTWQNDLAQHGVKVDYCQFAGEHEIPLVVIQKSRDYLERVTKLNLGAASQ